jgi:hypothetical protein
MGPAGAAWTPTITIRTSSATSAAAAAKGTLVPTSASCLASEWLLGGGAMVTTDDPANYERAVLTSSYPSAVRTWTAIGMVGDAKLANGKTITTTVYAICAAGS